MQDIKDSEIRLIGGGIPTPPNPKSKWKLLIIIAIALITVLAIVGIIIGSAIYKTEQVEPSNSNSATLTLPELRQSVNPYPLKRWLDTSDTIQQKGCLIKDTIVNDIPIRIYLPKNAVARLGIGSKCLKRDHTLLVAEAADIRADNGKINGAFVLAGTPKAWGLSKKGYCAIIHDSIQVGMADNSPLFEEASETGGYFFRQYALVNNSEIVINELKNQARRRALCEIDNHIVIVETMTRIGLYDFSQLLVDLYTNNALYLIGGETLGFARTLDNQTINMSDSVNIAAKQLKNINYIYWE